MTKYILSTIIAVLTMVSIPAQASAEMSAEPIEAEMQNVSISVSESTIHVVGANGQVLYIYNAVGKCVATIKVEGADKRYDLNLPKGCYILKVGRFVRKMSIR